MKLYYSPGSCSLAPHIVLREADRRFELDRVDLRTKRTASGRNFLEINPKGSVPVLQLDGDHSETLTEVEVVLQYIGDLAADARLLPASGTFARYHLQEWLAFVATELHKPFSFLRKPDTPDAMKPILRDRICDRLRLAGDTLRDRAFLMGESFTVADAYLFVVLLWASKLRIDVPPHVEDYASRIAHRFA
jgi:glutathione S-transferase